MYHNRFTSISCLLFVELGLEVCIFFVSDMGLSITALDKSGKDSNCLVRALTRSSQSDEWHCIGFTVFLITLFGCVLSPWVSGKKSDISECNFNRSHRSFRKRKVRKTVHTNLIAFYTTRK